MLVTGAGGVVGPCVCERLTAKAYAVCSVGRSPGSAVVADLSRPESLVLRARYDALVHTAPLWLLPDNFESMTAAGVSRVIAFSSTSVASKRRSPVLWDRELAQRLGSAEDTLRDMAASAGIALTLIRPTMIYGFGRDRNVTAIADLIRRLGFFPVAGNGSGLRQPVHASDLADAAVTCIEAETTFGRRYDLGGAEVLTYADMVRRIARALGRRPRLLHLPTPLYRMLIGVAARLSLTGGVSTGAADRMNQDLCFDTAPARNDFGYQGSAFLDNPARDLPGAVPVS